MAIPDLTDKIVRPVDRQYCEAGGFGDVFRCWYKHDDSIQGVAVKSFRFSFSADDEHTRNEGKTARMIRRELGIWKRLSHPNIVPFLGIARGFGRQGSTSLVSMWMPHGTLDTFLELHDDSLAVAHRLQLLLDIANGLQYLHSFPVIHGDLTSKNVLLNHNYNACLADFGCASLVGELPEAFTYLKMSTVRPGTLRWAAPEHFSLNEGETSHTIESDIYSFGNMSLLVLSGKYPWSEVQVDAAVLLCLFQGLKPSRPLARPIDDQHWALIEQCWSAMPERPLVGDVVSSLQRFLGAYPPPLSLRDILDDAKSSPSVSVRPGSDDLGYNVPQVVSQQIVTIVTYCYDGELVYVPLAQNYIQALSRAREAFPQLKDLHDASLSLFVRRRSEGPIGISASAWPKLIAHMEPYQTIDVHTITVTARKHDGVLPTRIPDITITYADVGERSTHRHIMRPKSRTTRSLHVHSCQWGNGVGFLQSSLDNDSWIVFMPLLGTSDTVQQSSVNSSRP